MSKGLNHRQKTEVILAGGIATSGVVIASLLAANNKKNLPVTVTFEVIDGDTSAPLAGASVALGNYTPVTADTSGIATFSMVPVATYGLVISAVGYQLVSEPVYVTSTATNFLIALQEDTACQPPVGGCACGTAWNTLSCTCIQQAPFSLDVLSLFSFSQTWNVQIWQQMLASPVICGTAGGGGAGVICTPNLPAPTGYVCPPSPADTIEIEVHVVPKDSNGAPICGMTVDASLNTGISNRWALTLGQALGTCPLSGDFQFSLQQGSVVTDSTGLATFVVNIQIADLQQTDCTCLDATDTPCASGSQSFSIPLELATSVPNTSVQALTQITMEAQICGYGYS